MESDFLCSAPSLSSGQESPLSSHGLENTKMQGIYSIECIKIILLTARVLDVSCCDCVSIVLLLIRPLSLTSMWMVGERAISGISSYSLFIASRCSCLFRCFLNITNIITIRISITTIINTSPPNAAPTIALTAIFCDAVVPGLVAPRLSLEEVGVVMRLSPEVVGIALRSLEEVVIRTSADVVGKILGKGTE